MKRLFSALLCLCLILSLGVPAMAADGDIAVIDLQAENLTQPVTTYELTLPTAAAVADTGCRTEDAGHLYWGYFDPDEPYFPDQTPHGWMITKPEVVTQFRSLFYTCDVYAEEGRRFAEGATAAVNGWPAYVFHVDDTHVRVYCQLEIQTHIRVEANVPDHPAKVNEPAEFSVTLTNMGTRTENMAEYVIGRESYDAIEMQEQQLSGTLAPGRSMEVVLSYRMVPYPDICGKDPVMDYPFNLILYNSGNQDAAVVCELLLPVETLPQEYRTGHLRFLDADGQETDTLYTQEPYTVELSFTNHFDFEMCVLPYGQREGTWFYFSDGEILQIVCIPVPGEIPNTQPGKTTVVRAPMDFTNYLKKFPSGGSHQVSYELIHVIGPDEFPPLDVEPISVTVIPGSEPGVPQTPGFLDVPADAYYADAVNWAVANGIASGTSSTTFEPNLPCTRAQAVSFLWRAAGCPEPGITANPFPDVQDTAYYYKAVLWAVENRVAAGMGDGTFAPNAQCSRAQIVSFLWNWENKPQVSARNPFVDVLPGKYYEQAVLWAVEQGITKGLTDSTFGPDLSCTRGQIACFLYHTPR